jgi:hypothetical protein
MSLLVDAATSAPERFVQWFNSPAREITGGLGLIALLVLVIEIIAMLPDIIRYIHISTM